MAKKKPFHQRKKVRPKSTPKAQSYDQLASQMKDIMGQDVQIEPGKGESMSDTLHEFIEPYYDDFNDSATALKNLCLLAMFAWNEAIMPSGTLNNITDTLTETVPKNESKEIRAELTRIVNDLMVRKKKYFAHNRRLMLGVEVIDEGGSNFYIQVASTPDHIE